MGPPWMQSWRSADRGDRTAPQTRGPWPLGTPRTHTHQEPGPQSARSQVHEVGAGGGFGARPSRTSGPRHIPPGASGAKNQRTWCKTTARSGHGPPRGAAAGRPIGSGYGRSSAEAVTTLGPTRLQDGPASSSAHARPEAMLTGLASVVGLEGALHGGSLRHAPRRGARRSMWLSCTSGARRKSSQG